MMILMFVTIYMGSFIGWKPTKFQWSKMKREVVNEST